MSEIELSWASGFLEGEGSFGKHKGGRARIQVCNTDPEPLLRLQVTLGGRVYGPYTAKYDSTLRNTKKPKDRWFWRIDKHDDAVFVMEMLRPLMSARRQAQIDLAIS